jgi:glycerol-3-phosphate dehydrogenase
MNGNGSNDRFDYIIIGAGAVGCAIARQIFISKPTAKVLLLEKNSDICMETSKHNSGVIHSGLHLNPSFLKAKFAREGSAKVVAFCKDKNVPYRKCGMIIAGTMPKISEFGSVFPQLGALKDLYLRAAAQRIPVRMLSPGGVRRFEPAIRTLLGIYVSEVHIIDSVAYVRALFADATHSGELTLVTDQRITRIEKDRQEYVVHGNNKVFRASCVINAAGLYAHDIARAAGFNYQVYFYSGEYYKVVSEKKNKINGTLIYPATKPGSPGLGIHITKKLSGDVYLGPNALPSAGPVFDPSKRTPPDVFVDAVKPFWPELEVSDVEWAYAGVRPKAVNKGEGDFIIKKDSVDPVFINLIGIESPGLTASMAIAEHVTGML